MKSGSHMRPAFVLGFYLEGAMIKGNNCLIRGQMTVFFGRISSLFCTRTRGGVLTWPLTQRFGSVFLIDGLSEVDQDNTKSPQHVVILLFLL